MRKTIHLIALLCMISSCKVYHASQAEWYFYPIKQDTSLVADSSTQAIISPYQSQLDGSMKEIVGYCKTELTKQRPEGTLNNFFADVMRLQARKYFGVNPDMAFSNYGGLRVPSLPKGPLTVNHIYELMPFDNELVLLTIDGATLLKIFEYMAARGGEPISGANFKINSGKPVDIDMGGSPLDLNKNYVICTSDYLANGGDDLTFLKAFKPQTKSIKIRDAIIDYLKEYKPTLDIKLDGRVQIKQ